MKDPVVSVLLSVRDGEQTLGAALRSIFGQTFTDFELVVVDDASTDGTAALLDACTDPRLIRLKNPVNLGLTRSLNLGLRAARGRYIARLDADDTSHPDRLALQVAYMEAHPEVGLLGAAAQTAEGADAGPVEETELRWWLLFDNVFIHSSVLFRAELVREAGYDETFLCAQDYALWSAWAGRTRLAKLPQPLVTLSTRAGRISHLRAREQAQFAERTSLHNLSTVLGKSVGPGERAALRRVFPRPPNFPDRPTLNDCRLCLRLFNAFLRQPRVDPAAARQLRRAWLLRVFNSLGWRQWPTAFASGLLLDAFRANPGTLLWYAWRRLRSKCAPQ